MRVSVLFATLVLVAFGVSNLFSMDYAWRKGVEDCLNAGSLCPEMYEGAK